MKRLLSIFILLTLILTSLVGCKPTEDAKEYLYNDFTPQEKSLLEMHLGEVIPFIANNGYYLRGLTEDDDYEHGMRYIVTGATQEDVEAYKTLLSKYGELETVKEKGGVVTHVEGDDLVFDLVAYLDNDGFMMEVSVTSKQLSEPLDDTSAPTPDPDPDPDPDPEPDPDPDPTEVGYYVSCRNSSSLLYFIGNVTDGRFDGSTNKSDAVLVFVEVVNGGYNLYFNRGNTKTYLVIDDNSTGAALTSNKSDASVFEWDSTLKTMKVANDDNNRALGMKSDSTYTTFSTYDAQNTSYNFASFKTASGTEFTPGNGGSVGGSDNTGGNGDTDGNGSNSGHLYTDFTSTEKGYFTQYLGKIIPFVANSEYYLDDYYGTDEDYYAYGFNFYTYGNTAAEFAAYKNAIVAAGFEFYEEYTDDYGDLWYTYYDGDIVIDVSYYEYEGEHVIDLYVYSETLSEEMPDDGGSGGNDSDSEDDNGGNSGGSGGTTDVDLITNDGKGLPTDSDGVFDVDFKDADKVKDVTNQGYYLDGCPTTGNPGVLVIPVEFSDVTAASKGYTIDKIVAAFNGASGTTDYFSVDEYYKISSYNQLDLDITVLDSWFRPQYNSSYYLNYKMDYYGTEIEAGDMLLINEILAYLESRMNLSQFDSDDNGTIDAIVIINTLDIDSDVTMQWAYRYWNVYTDDDGSYYEYDGVYANDYLWASYAFMYESDDGGSFDDTTALNTYTYIHEFGHILGADDYYDTAGVTSPMDGCDVMDSMLGDHNAFTKFNYGWITESRLVVTDDSVTLMLEDFSKNGDTIIIANNWDETLGAYQEYFIVVYYTNNGLNGTDGAGYFDRNGIVVYRINASLYSEEMEGEVYYDIYNNNTDSSDEYGTEDNLIEFVKSSDDTFTYVVGDTLPTVILTSGDTLVYTFVVNSIGAESATLTFTKIA